MSNGGSGASSEPDDTAEPSGVDAPEHGAPGGDAIEGDAIEQVQRAVLTMIGAARVVLDTLQTVVADRARLDELAAQGRGVVGSVLDPLFGGLDGCAGGRRGAAPGAQSEPDERAERGARAEPGTPR